MKMMGIKNRKIAVMETLLKSVSRVGLKIVTTDQKKKDIKEATRGMVDGIAIVMSNMDKFISSDEIEILLKSEDISVAQILEVVAMYETDGKAKKKLQEINGSKPNVDELDDTEEIKEALKDIIKIIEKEL